MAAAKSLAVLLCCGVLAALAYQPTPHGVLVTIGSTYQVELAVQGKSAFRVSVAQNAAPVQIDSPIITVPEAYASFTVQSSGNVVGIMTTFGSVSIDSTSSQLQLKDGNGTILTSAQLLDNPSGSANKDVCTNARQSTDISGGTRVPRYPDGLSGQTQQGCCSLCNGDGNCTTWVWADNTHPDPSGKNCWLLYNVDSFVPRAGRTSGGTALVSSLDLHLGIKSQSTKFFGAGGGHQTVMSLTATSSYPHVSNTEFNVPYFWTTDGYSAVGVTGEANNPHTVNNYDASWNAGQNVLWTFAGTQADLYLMPAATIQDSLPVYWELTGKPKVLPRYAYGFMASRWGWANNSYIEDMLTQFRSGSYPIDAWISDFEWYTPQPDYSLPDSGSPTFVDFGYNNITFPQPIPQLKHYHDDLNLRFGGIRKPRLGNTDTLNMARQRGWILSQSAGGSGGARNLNYSIPAVRDWYASQIAHFLPDGVDFWWNDEGETVYFTFFWWNSAQVQALAAYNPKKRFFTINRSYSPGMQRLGLVIWTGDIQVSWESMQHQPAYATAWTLAGTPYVTCDIGGFSGPDDPADLLARWYQSGALLPIMRVHSDLSDRPHFPFLYNEAAANAMRNALHLRYQLLPYTYSLAHAAYAVGTPLARPLYYHFPTDNRVLSITDQWFFGPSLMAAPILTSSDGSTTDTSRQVYLPAGTWYQVQYSANLTAVAKINGPSTITVSNIGLDTILFFAPAGAVVPLAPIVQYSDALPGGPLTVVVFPGADGSFNMYEDDGETNTYTGDASALRTTTYSWSSTENTLRWTVAGAFSDQHTFTQVRAVLADPAGTRISAATAIGARGSISF